METNNADVPELSEISDVLQNVDKSLEKVGSCLEPILGVSSSVNREQTNDANKSKLSTLERAKLDLICLYATNAIFWVYLRSEGVNPAVHGLPDELARVKTHMTRLREVQDRGKSSKSSLINKQASKRVVRNALWSAAHKSETGQNLTSQKASQKSKNENVR